jgi:hypothetical protein
MPPVLRSGVASFAEMDLVTGVSSFSGDWLYNLHKSDPSAGLRCAKSMGMTQEHLDTVFTLIDHIALISFADIQVGTITRSNVYVYLRDCSVPHMVKIALPSINRFSEVQGFKLYIAEGCKSIFNLEYVAPISRYTLLISFN